MRRTFGRVAWKSKNSSGSIVAKRAAPSDAPTNCSAAEAASPASFQPLKAHTRAGARRPSGRLSQSQRLHPDHGTRWAAWRSTSPSACQARAQTRSTGVFACTRKDRLVDAHGHAVPRARAARPHGRGRRRARSATPTCSPAASSAATSCACAGASSASATSCRSRCAAIDRAPRRDADPAAFLPAAYRDLDELDGFLEHLAGEVHDPGYRALLDGLLGDDGCAPRWRRAPCTRGGHHAYLGGLLEHTVAVAHARAGDVRAAPAAELRPADHRGARARPRQDARVHATAPRSG